MKQIGTFLWFDGRAEEAAEFYVSIFPNSEILSISRYLEGSPGPAGSVMTVDFLLNGSSFTALNGGPEFQFTSAISLMVYCDSQDEVDHFWRRLTAGGQEVQCGWLTDKFGVSWQVVPVGMGDLLGGPDAAAASRAMAAMLTMKKIDINEMRRAYENG